MRPSATPFATRRLHSSNGNFANETKRRKGSLFLSASVQSLVASRKMLPKTSSQNRSGVSGAGGATAAPEEEGGGAGDGGVADVVGGAAFLSSSQPAQSASDAIAT